MRVSARVPIRLKRVARLAVQPVPARLRSGWQRARNVAAAAAAPLSRAAAQAAMLRQPSPS
jgi:hypothetical protein